MDQDDDESRLTMMTVADKQRYGIMWFWTGAAIVGLIWLYSSHWDVASKILTSTRFWVIVAVGSVISFFNYGRKTKRSL